MGETFTTATGEALTEVGDAALTVAGDTAFDVVLLAALCSAGARRSKVYGEGVVGGNGGELDGKFWGGAFFRWRVKDRVGICLCRLGLFCNNNLYNRILLIFQFYTHMIITF